MEIGKGARVKTPPLQKTDPQGWATQRRFFGIERHHPPSVVRSRTTRETSRGILSSSWGQTRPVRCSLALIIRGHYESKPVVLVNRYCPGCFGRIAVVVRTLSNR